MATNDKPSEALTISGPVTQTALKAQMEIQTDVSVTYTEEELAKVRKRLTNLRTGSTAALPLTCHGQACPFSQQCIFFELDKHQLNKPCLIEINLLNEWRSLYVDEYDIDPTKLSQITLINELAEIELMLWRLNNNLAKAEHADLTVVNDIGMDTEGNVLSRREVSSFFEARERLLNRKSRVIRSMVGDRENKYKERAALKQADSGDPSSKTADLRSHVEGALIQIAKNQALAKEALLPAGEDSVTPSTLSPDDLISGGE